MRYGMNPHQAARLRSPDASPVTLVNGEASLINWLDMLNAWQLVREAAAPLDKPVAASFKHVSPAGVATAGTLDATALDLWGPRAAVPSPMLSAYVRARDADPKSSFGDVVALSGPCDMPTAEFLSGVVTDAVIAPAYEPGVVELLSRKKQGRFLVAQVDPTYDPGPWETRTVFGVELEQQRDTAPIDPSILPQACRTDGVLGQVTLRYTQSNSVSVGMGGMVLGIGAGQQNRVDCARLAGAKARTWWLRRHPIVRRLTREDMKRQDRLNWQIRFAEGTLTPTQEQDLIDLFGTQAGADYRDTSWRNDFIPQLNGLVMCSDGFLPFPDNVEVAADYGVSTIIEPGGSMRTPQVQEACTRHNISHITTGLRLFHH